jgi:tRNA uridine 5-carboxymethylaminomethyl modification enzyme
MRAYQSESPLHALSQTRPANVDEVYDVVVVGGGHAGAEAASASARIGAKTLLVTSSLESVGAMSCNPSIGGVGKGHLVREVDALGGLMALAADVAGIQFKMLNRSKGPAVWGPRAQADRELYRDALQHLLVSESGNRLHVLEGDIDDLELSNVQHDQNHDQNHDDDENDRQTSKIDAVRLRDGRRVACNSVVLTTGTFLGGVIMLGRERLAAGRMGDGAATALSKTLARHNLRLGRLKTGTPPRLARSSIDFSALEENCGDAKPVPFSFGNDVRGVSVDADAQLPCHVTYTNERTHEIVRDNVHLCPDFESARDDAPHGNGPRYCPSIELKVSRFAERDRHLVWLEPEGFDSPVVYPNGLSCSIPFDAQIAMMRSIAGLERVELLQPGYAVEYDFVDPRSLRPSLQLDAIGNLFLAGQINGTTGYEEAAAQGIVAGINAALSVDGGREPFVLDRGDAYIGVLVDDLSRIGTSEPYRMFTSRAEFRLSLRADNADFRLTDKGHRVGCVSDARHAAMAERRAIVERVRAELDATRLSSHRWAELGYTVAADGRYSTCLEMLRRERRVGDRERVQLDTLLDELPELAERLGDDGRRQSVAHTVASEALYSHYVKQQQRDIELLRRDEQLELPATLDYALIDQLSTEEQLALSAAKPTNIGAASRIPGMRPASLTALLRFVRKQSSI